MRFWRFGHWGLSSLAMCQLGPDPFCRHRLLRNIKTRKRRGDAKKTRIFVKSGCPLEQPLKNDPSHLRLCGCRYSTRGVSAPPIYKKARNFGIATSKNGTGPADGQGRAVAKTSPNGQGEVSGTGPARSGKRGLAPIDRWPKRTSPNGQRESSPIPLFERAYPLLLALLRLI